MAYLIQLRHFEGPLDLLLYLIRKEEMDIFDININEITKQFLEYIKIMKELDLEGAGDFIAMAATLIHIKSRMLLPQYNEEGEVVEQEDPRKELVQKLLEYQKFQAAGKSLYDRALLNRDVWTRGTRERGLEIEGDEIELDDDGLFGLIASYRKAMQRMEKNFHKVKAKFQSIASRIMELKEVLQVGTRVILRDLLQFGHHAKQPRLQLLITFLSVLELGRLGFVSLFQSEVYGDIHIETKKTIDTNVVERVQEFETQINNAAATAVNVLENEQMQLMIQENPSMEAPALTEEQLLAAFEKAPESEMNDVINPEDIATDEEIEAALAEIEGRTPDINVTEVVEHEHQVVADAPMIVAEAPVGVPIAGESEIAAEIPVEAAIAAETSVAAVESPVSASIMAPESVESEPIAAPVVETPVESEAPAVAIAAESEQALEGSPIAAPVVEAPVELAHVEAPVETVVTEAPVIEVPTAAPVSAAPIEALVAEPVEISLAGLESSGPESVVEAVEMMPEAAIEAMNVREAPVTRAATENTPIHDNITNDPVTDGSDSRPPTEGEVNG